MRVGRSVRAFLLGWSLPSLAAAAQPPTAAPAPPLARPAQPAAAPGATLAHPAQPAPSAAFEEGLKAAAAGNLGAAMDQMEAALAGDPDNLRYASEYRHVVIRAGGDKQPGPYDRALDFFAKLVADHPNAPYAWLNYGYAYVDRMPAAGAITQVILANDALKMFTRSLELKETWLALYTRGNSYLFWPKVFGKTPLAVADLERAMAIAKQEGKRGYQAHGYAALGDAYWRSEQPERARAIWEEGARWFPRDEKLKQRVERKGDDLEAYVADQLDRTKRVDTDLHQMWEER